MWLHVYLDKNGDEIKLLSNLEAEYARICDCLNLVRIMVPTVKRAPDIR